MRVVPRFQTSEDDNQQKFWVFGPNFVQNFTESSSEVEEEEEEEEREEPPPPPPPLPLPRNKKRPRESSKKSESSKKGKKKTTKKRESKKNKKEKPEGSTIGGGGAGRERWTMERYERAEIKVLEVMREKMAELGNRVMRRDLREEARKHIGDTGLLDHLLKHMAGKVVGNRGERFMRGYSNDGVMHYWLEPAEVEESRRKGELEGCRCGSDCKEEIDMLKERIGVLNRYIATTLFIVEFLGALRHRLQ